MDERNESAHERGRFEQPRIKEQELGGGSLMRRRVGGTRGKKRKREKETRFDGQTRVSEELREAEVVVVS